jgi:hypothetical protein
MATVEAKWSGKWPCLCHGKWTLIVDGVDVSDKIPEELRDSPMNTYGEYRNFRFTEDWEVEWYSYCSGLEVEGWIEENLNWLKTITTDKSTMQQIYYEINSKDFQYGCCGGCI